MATSMFYGAQKHTFQFAALLRKNLTPAEQALWDKLQNNNLFYRFRCQHPVSRYVVDFYCQPLRFVIEVDGSIHLLDEIHQTDAYREENLKKLGLYIHRFTNDQVLFQMDSVLEEINQVIQIISAHVPYFHDLDYREIG